MQASTHPFIHQNQGFHVSDMPNKVIHLTPLNIDSDSVLIDDDETNNKDNE